MWRCTGRIDCKDVGKWSVGRKRCRFGRPAIPKHLALGKRAGRDRISLIATEKDDVITIITIVERHVPGRGIRVATPEDDDAAALRLLFQVLAEFLVVAGQQSMGTAITRQ